MADLRPKKQRRLRGVLAPEWLQQAVAERLRKCGVSQAEEESGINREQLLGVAAGIHVQVGTVLRTELWMRDTSARGEAS